MSCVEMRERLIDYRHRELDPRAAALVAAHLSGCAECALEYCRLDADLAGISRALEEEPPPELHRRLRARVAAEHQRSPLSRLWSYAARPVPVYQAALLAAAVLLAWFLLTGLPARGPAPVLFDHYDASTVLAVDPELL